MLTLLITIALCLLPLGAAVAVYVRHDALAKRVAQAEEQAKSAEARAIAAEQAAVAKAKAEVAAAREEFAKALAYFKERL